MKRLLSLATLYPNASAPRFGTFVARSLEALAALGVKHVALRCAGFNGVDLVAAKELGFLVTRVPAYSPYAVAEHAR